MADESPNAIGRNSRKNSRAPVNRRVFCGQRLSTPLSNALSITEPSMIAVNTSTTPTSAERKPAIQIQCAVPRILQRKNGHKDWGGGPSAAIKGSSLFKSQFMCYPFRAFCLIAVPRNQHTAHLSSKAPNGCQFRQFFLHPARQYGPSEQLWKGGVQWR